MSIAVALGGAAAALAGGRLLMAQRKIADRSSFFLGRTLAHEKALSASAGVELDRFLVLMQRLIWGVLQPDLIHVDLAATCQQIRAEHPQFFLTHLVIAFVERSRGRTAEADAALAQARALLPTAHPFSHVMPTEKEWACEPPEVTGLEEPVPGTIWRIPGYFTHGLAPFHEFMYATLIRLRSGGLVLMNPVAMTPELVAAVRALGEVTHIVTPVKFHNLFIAEAQRNFPTAKCYGVRGHSKNPPSQHLRFDGFLDDRQPLFPGELEQVAVAGHQLEETAFFHTASRTAIFHDILYANQMQVPGYTFWWRLYALTWGVHDDVAVGAFHPMMWTSVPALRRSLRKVLAWDAERVLICHAPAAAVPARGKEVLRHTFGWIEELGVPEYLVLVSGFFRRQPGFLRDFLVYLVKQR